MIEEQEGREEYEGELLEDEGVAEQQRRETLYALAESLLKKRDEAIEGRSASGVERRWREDQDAFDGLDAASKTSMMDYATGEAPSRKKEAARSRVVVNIVRGKTETAEGRFADILMPVDDRNWGLKVTPVPELQEQLTDNRPAVQMGAPVTNQQGQQVAVADVAKDMMAQAKKKMSAMETEIDDQLTECDYNAECRRVVADAAKLGTGILKGPTVVKRIKKRWKPLTDMGMTVHQIQIEEEQRPSSKRVDPWNVYPDPSCGDDIRKAAYIWEKDTILPRDLRKLIGLPGYFEDQIISVLSEEPRRTYTTMNKKGQEQVQTSTIAKGGLYEVWEYHGDVGMEELSILGCECPDEIGGDSFSACIVFVNDRPIKVALNVLDTGDLPYDFFQWTKVADSPWGIGPPRMLIWQQRIITAAWRSTMDNSGDSSGAQRVISKDIEPADGRWEFTRNKAWWYTGDGDVRQAFAQFQVDSRQVDLQNIIDLALRFSDMETQVPMIFQGEIGKAPETLGATNIMVDSNNVSIRQRVKRFDDCITTPHLTRYYDWNMQYSDKDEIKGDYQVDARGVRVLLEKDQQAQAIIQLWPLLADPEIAAKVDKGKAAQQIFSAHRLDILKEQQQIEQEEQQQQQAPPDAGMAAAQVRAEAQIQVAQLNQQSDMEELKLKQAMSEADRVHEKELKQMELQIQMMKFANERNISLESIKAVLAGKAMDLKVQKELAMNKTASVPQVAEPAVEPQGRAPDGEAFQR
jgi:hypothetical protein